MNRLLLAVLLLPMSSVAVAETRVPAYVLELPDSVTGVFIADTGAATIYRFERSPAGLAVGHKGYMSIGENGAGKQRAGDRRTPLGIYFVVDRLDTTRLHEKYGITAYPLDYPNIWDRRHEKTGDGIWLHGVLAGGGRRPPLDTDGCLALPNEDLRELEDSFAPLRTPVIVTPGIEWHEAAQSEAITKELKSSIGQWVAALSARDARAYLSMYSPDFRYRSMSFSEWALLRAHALARRTTLNVDIDELMLLADPVEEGLYLSRFRHTVTDDETTTVTMKRLYWQRDTAGKLKIVAEDNG